jgi:hypothetical protein
MARQRAELAVHSAAGPREPMTQVASNGAATVAIPQLSP